MRVIASTGIRDLVSSEAQDAAGGDLHEADLLPDRVDQEAVDRAEVVTVPVLDHPPPDVLVRDRHDAIEVLQFVERGIHQCAIAPDAGVSESS